MSRAANKYLIALRAAGAALCCLLGAPLLAADDEPPAEEKAKGKFELRTLVSLDPKRQSESELAIRKALTERATVIARETPLSELLDTLRKEHDIEIQLDKASLEENGLTAEDPLTRTIRGVSLESALNLLLADLNLGWTIQDEVLLVTTKFKLDRMRSVKIYPVERLITPEVTAEKLASSILELVNDPLAAPLPILGGIDGGGGLLTDGGVAETNARIVAFRGRLIVRASETKHRAIADLLQQLATSLARENVPDKTKDARALEINVEVSKPAE